MTRKERVIMALSHKEPDIVPFHAEFTIPELEKMIRYTGDPEFESKTGGHLHSTQYWGWPTELPERKGYFKDEFGVTWNRSGADKDIGVVDRYIIPAPDIRLWKEPALDVGRLRSEYQEVIDTKGDRFAFAGIGFSLFERIWSLCGMENVLIYMVEEPEFVHALLDAICEFNLKIIDIASEYPFDGFYFGDDWGQQKGLIMGPAHWREYIKPRVKEMYARAKKDGRFVIAHSCGYIHELYPDLIDIGLDCHQTFQPEIYDIEGVKREFGDYLAFWGGISTQRLLPYATPEKVKEETARIMRIMGKNGGYIASPTHSVPADVPPENILAMLDVFQNQARYLCR